MHIFQPMPLALPSNISEPPAFPLTSPLPLSPKRLPPPFASILFSMLMPLQPTLHPAVRSIRSQDCSAHHPPMAPPPHSKLTPSSLWDQIPQTTFHSATVRGASFPSVEHTRHVPMSGSVIIPSARSTPTTLVRSLIFFRSLLSCHLYNEASPV